MNMISISSAGNTLLLLFGFLFIFHVLILLGVIPYDIVWAGKIKNRNELIKLEFISLFVLGMATIIVSLKTGHLDFLQNEGVINVGMWILVALFTLNTVGNLTAINPVEKYGFGLLTLVMALLTLRLSVT